MPRTPDSRSSTSRRRLTSIAKDEAGLGKESRLKAGRLAETLRLRGEKRATALVAKSTGFTKRQVAYAQQLVRSGTENLAKFGNWVFWFRQKGLDWKKVKFLDEVHFTSRDCSKSKVVTPLNTQAKRLNKTPVGTRMTATAITCPASFHAPVYFELREDSNTQFDFSEFVLRAVEKGALQEGDVLALDNAAVHLGADSFPILEEHLAHCNIEIKFLSAYSPELNPVELVFARVKNFLRTFSWEDFVPAIVYAFGQVTQEQVQSFYAKAANHALRVDSTSWPDFFAAAKVVEQEEPSEPSVCIVEVVDASINDSNPAE